MRRCGLNWRCRLVFSAVPGVHCFAWAFSSCGEWGPLFIAVCRLLIAELRLRSAQASVAVVHRLSCPAACGILVSRPGIEPVSSALAGRFLTTRPLGKSLLQISDKAKERARRQSFWLFVHSLSKYWLSFHYVVSGFGILRLAKKI